MFDFQIIADLFNQYIKEKYGLNYPRTKILYQTPNTIWVKTTDYPSKISTKDNGWCMKSSIDISADESNLLVFKFKENKFYGNSYEMVKQ